jgi:tetratricopeptide (TPR) repeat protein/transcriptional regulator with XRE-family HTH domain
MPGQTQMLVPAPRPAFDSFGEQLRFLRRRARITQRELGRRVGYSEGHICRLEQNQRVPELAVLGALFVPALGLGCDPSAAVRLMELAEQARSGRDVPAPASEAGEPVPAHIPVPPAHAVERDDALGDLAALLDTEPVVVVSGLAGTGKTTLAATLARSRAEVDQVCWVTATAGLTSSPEALVRQLARHLDGYGRSGLAALVRRRDGERPLPLDRQLDLLASALAQRPTLMCLDNAQVVDPGVLDTLVHLITASPGQLLLTSRTLLALPGATTYRLSGLDPRRSAELINRLDPAMPAPLAARLAETTAGNPMLLRLALGQTRAPGADRRALIERLATNPEIVDYLLKTTLEQLGPAAERLVSLLSVFRHPVDLHDAALADASQADDGPYDLVEALAELRRRQLVDDPVTAALHPLVRAQTRIRLLGDLPRRRRLHRIAAQWCEQNRDDVLESAWHFARAGEVAQAVEVLAGRVRDLIGRGQALAADSLAGELLDRVRRGPQPAGELTRRLLVLRGDLLLDTTRAEAAEEAYRLALAMGGPAPVRADIARRLAESLLHRGRVPQALRLCQDAIAELSTQDTLLSAQLAATQARALLQLSDYDSAVRVGEEALALSAQLATIAPVPAADAAANAGFAVGVVLRLRARHAEAAEQLRRAAQQAHRAGLHNLANRCLLNLGVLHLEQSDIAQALQVWQGLAEQMRITGDSFGQARVSHGLAVAYHQRGDLAAALQHYDQACAQKQQLGDVQGLASSQQARAMLLRGTGRIEEARHALRAILDGPAAHTEPWARMHYVDSYATTLLMVGEVEAATELLREAVELARQTGKPFQRLIEYHLAMARLVAGDPGPARALAAAPLPDRSSILEAQLEGRMLRAAVALVDRDAAAVAEVADDVAAWIDATGMGLFRDKPAALRAAALAPPAIGDLPRLVWLP